MFLRRFARPSSIMMMSANKVKQTTGLEVVPNAREVLIDLYGKTLEEVELVPEDEGYRKAVESLTRHRLSVCEEEQDCEAIEKRLGCGPVEELIQEARDELKIIVKMLEWDPWGMNEDYICKLAEIDDLVPKQVPRPQPGPIPEELYAALAAAANCCLQKDGPAVSSSTE